MVSLCGLALSSLFVINTKSIVHADTVNNSDQNSAISWDSDNDDSQVVSDTRTKTEQADVQTADDHQQNAAQPVQSHAEPNNVKFSSIQRSTPVQNNAETSTASSSSVQNNTINHETSNNNSINVHVNKVVSVPRMQNAVKSASSQTVNSGSSEVTQLVQDAPKVTPIVINNSQIRVHYVDSNGYSIQGVNDYDIYVDSNSEDSYDVPTGYTLRNPDGEYNLRYETETVHHAAVTHVVHHPASGFWYDEPNSNLSHIGSDYTHKGTHKVWIKTDPYDETVVDRKAYDSQEVSVQQFVDNTGNVRSVSGNMVNVVLIKPQNVDPASDARMRATATRTIQINFPGTIPPSYKNIVNDKGVLTQTVTFMRTGQEDALTGDLINSTLTPWKSNNQDPNFLGFPERTLPRIPGYTLSIKPA